MEQPLSQLESPFRNCTHTHTCFDAAAWHERGVNARCVALHCVAVNAVSLGALDSLDRRQNAQRESTDNTALAQQRRPLMQAMVLDDAQRHVAST